MIPVSPTPAWKHLGVSYYFVVSANLTCIPVDIGEVEVVMTKSLDISPLTAVLVSSEESTVTSVRLAMYLFPSGLDLTSTVRTNLPLLSSRIAEFGTTVS